MKNPPHLKDCSIVIADDDFIIRSIIKHIVKELHIPVFETENGKECLNKIDSLNGRHVLLILDINMPIMDGYEVIKKISEDKDSYKNVKIIVLSATASLSEELKRRDLNEHIFTHLQKPVDRELLLHTLITATI